MIKWGSREYGARMLTAGDWYHWVVELRAPFLTTSRDDVDAIRLRLEACVAWIASVTNTDMVGLSEDTALAATEGMVITDFGDHLFNTQVYHRADIVRASLEIDSKCLGFKTDEHKPCKCSKCLGGESDGACLYGAAGVVNADRMVASVNPTVLSQLWDRPYYLYVLSCQQRSAEALGDLKRHAEREDPESGKITGPPTAAKHLSQARRLKAKQRGLSRGNS